MDRTIQLIIFNAQVDNVRELDKSWKHIKRSINRDLLKGNQSAVRLQTKLLSLVYCSWLEARFSKLIHTPYGFELCEIEQIKKASRDNVVNGWKECIAIAVLKINHGKSNYVPNIKQRLTELIELYVEKPSQLRNKIAHGQWIKALNRDNTAINNNLTNEIKTIDVVKLDILYDACKGLCDIVEALIESPNRTFHREYWIILANLEAHLERTAEFSLSDKVNILKAKQQIVTPNI